MQIDSIEYHDHLLRATCSGVFGIGSQGQPSATLLRESIEEWMLSHPTDRVDHMVIDYTKVEYEWGDGPASSMISFIKGGVNKVRLVANHRNLLPLRNLFTENGLLMWFEVEEDQA